MKAMKNMSMLEQIVETRGTLDGIERALAALEPLTEPEVGDAYESLTTLRESLVDYLKKMEANEIARMRAAEKAERYALFDGQEKVFASSDREAALKALSARPKLRLCEFTGEVWNYVTNQAELVQDYRIGRLAAAVGVWRRFTGRAASAV